MLGSFESTGQHFFDVDSRGNIYTCGRFLPQKFVPDQPAGAVADSGHAYVMDVWRKR